MAMNAEGSSSKPPLHNFTMPCDLRWGDQRFFRCKKVNSDCQISPQQHLTETAADSHYPQHRRRHHRSVSTHHSRSASRYSSRRESAFADGSREAGFILPSLPDHGIAAVREKVMSDLQTAAGKMKDAIFKNGHENCKVPVDAPPPSPLCGESLRPWSLRTRRAASKTTPLGGDSPGVNGFGSGSGSGDGGNNNNDLTVDAGVPISGSSPTRSAPPPAGKSPIPVSGEKRDRPKFSVALSKKAIQEDFFSMAGHRPSRRPKKRAKMIQKQLDTLFPGLWLTEIKADMYKVIEPVP